MEQKREFSLSSYQTSCLVYLKITTITNKELSKLSSQIPNYDLYTWGRAAHISLFIKNCFNKTALLPVHPHYLFPLVLFLYISTDREGLWPLVTLKCTAWAMTTVLCARLLSLLLGGKQSKEEVLATYVVSVGV